MDHYEETKIKHKVAAQIHLQKIAKPTTAEEAAVACTMAISIKIPSCSIAYLVISEIVHDWVWWTCIDFNLDPSPYRL